MELKNKALKAFQLMHSDYDKVFRSFYPSQGSNGFTERNQTFFFTKNFLSLDDSAICWQEVPFDKNGEHIDTVIHIPEPCSIIYIEAKRVKNGDSLNAIASDVNRVCGTSSNVLRKDIIKRMKLKNEGAPIKEYMVVLADVWEKPRSFFKKDFSKKWKGFSDSIFKELGIVKDELILEATDDTLSETWGREYLNTKESYHLLLAVWEIPSRK